MIEHDAHDPASLDHSWKQHNWTGEEAQFAAQMLQHGDPGRAWAASFGWGNKVHRHTALMRGEEVMQAPWMREYIAHVRGMIKARMDVSKDRILEELSALAYSNQADFIVIQEDGTAATDLSGLTREQLAAIQEVTVETYMDGRGEDAPMVKSVKVKLFPKVAALELLGKHQKMFTDVLEHNDLTDIGDVMTKRRQQRRKRQGEDDDENDDDGN